MATLSIQPLTLVRAKKGALGNGPRSQRIYHQLQGHVGLYTHTQTSVKLKWMYVVLVYVPMTILLWVHARLGFSGSSTHVLASTSSIASQKVSNCNTH